MRLKSFHANSMAEAMRQVREILGEDAIIVATREEEGVGVRVTAAVEEDDFSSAPGAGSVADFSDGDLLDPAEQVSDALLRHGVPGDLANRLGESVRSMDTEDATTALAAALEAVFAFQPLAEGKGARPLMLVGPPGAGKTLTLAKLATRAKLRGKSVGVISTDTIRAGGIEQLSSLTRVLKLRLMTVEDPMALGDALEVHRGAELVLVDSAGRNPYDTADMKELRDFLVAADIEPVLVLPAGGDAHEAADMARLFRSLGARRLLVTRLDTSRRLGSLLHAAHEAGLAFCDASTTSKVAEGLVPLSPKSLAALLLPDLGGSQRNPKQTGTHA